MPAQAEWVTVAHVADVPAGHVAQVRAGERDYALVNLDGKFYAVDNNCPHMGGPLAKGTLKGHDLICPWHAWRWDVTNGRNRAPGVDWRLMQVPVHIVGDEIQLPVI